MKKNGEQRTENGDALDCLHCEGERYHAPAPSPEGYDARHQRSSRGRKLERRAGSAGTKTSRAAHVHRKRRKHKGKGKRKRAEATVDDAPSPSSPCHAAGLRRSPTSRICRHYAPHCQSVPHRTHRTPELHIHKERKRQHTKREAKEGRRRGPQLKTAPKRTSRKLHQPGYRCTKVDDYAPHRRLVQSVPQAAAPTANCSCCSATSAPHRTEENLPKSNA
ncbi:hypothetical protein DFH06DRAFT_1242674 [Mycena polygramma]|nr:hypothetical protein DFH06DRAFT_1242674 [Mycena polygramma]